MFQNRRSPSPGLLTSTLDMNIKFNSVGLMCASPMLGRRVFSAACRRGDLADGHEPELGRLEGEE